jgi:hypothetical protein
LNSRELGLSLGFHWFARPSIWHELFFLPGPLLVDEKIVCVVARDGATRARSSDSIIIIIISPHLIEEENLLAI